MGALASVNAHQLLLVFKGPVVTEKWGDIRNVFHEGMIILCKETGRKKGFIKETIGV